MKRGDVHRARVEQHEIRQDRDEWLMQMDQVELLAAENRLDRVVERDIERDAHHASVGRNRNGAADAVETVSHLQPTLPPSRRQNRYVMTVSLKLGAQMGDVLVDATWVRGVIWRYKRNLH